MLKHLLGSVSLLSALAFGFTATGTEDPGKGGNAQELGVVKWQRDWDKVTQTAKETGKPRLLLFQEVPG